MVPILTLGRDQIPRRQSPQFAAVAMVVWSIVVVVAFGGAIRMLHHSHGVSDWWGLLE